MNSRLKQIAGLALALIVATAASLPAGAVSFGRKKKEVVIPKLTPDQSALVDKSIAREKVIVKTVRERTPLVETYIQNMKPDPIMRQVPESDQHYLGRVDFGKVIGESSYKEGPKSGEKKGIGSLFKGSVGFLSGIGGSLHLQFNEAGFTQMLLMDSNNFDKQHYNFIFVRNDFLGAIPTSVFDVTPLGKNDTGRFFGRIWIERQGGNVVRFNGDFAGSDKSYQEFFHFDSWRTNVQEGLWLPTSFYVEESDPKSQTSTLKFKAINYIWGYRLKVPQTVATDAEMTVENAQNAQQDPNSGQDYGPRASQDKFVQQAEDNVLERLYLAGLLDAPSEFDKTLEALANNILAYNNIQTRSPIRVRTLLTEPLESFAVGNTIVLSKSLIDTTAVITTDGAQQTGNLNALLAFQIAHIITGHRLDTKYAFNDRLLFPDSASFQRIPMHHTATDNTEAAKKALELLNAKELVDGQKYFGLYLQQLQARVKALKALNEPIIGDGLVKSDSDSTFWMAALLPKGEKLDLKNLKQEAAEPLASFLRRDPWTDQVITLHTAIEPILSPSDKMPFEVAPVYIRLSYYQQPTAPATPNPAAPNPADQTAPPAAPADSTPGTPNPAPANPTVH